MGARSKRRLRHASAAGPGAELFFSESASWGLGGAVITRRTDLWTTPGRYGWDGGYGSSALDFWTSAYQAIDD